MTDILQPARGLLETLSRSELFLLASRKRIRLDPDASRAQLVAELTSRLRTSELAAALTRLFPKRWSGPVRDRKPGPRLDRVNRLRGQATVQVHARSRPGQGQVLLGTAGRRGAGPSYLVLKVPNIQLLLEDRWPVTATEARAGRVPSKSAPFIVDEGKFCLGGSRLRLELVHSGPLAFRVTFLRYKPPAGRPQYLFQPIA